MKIVKLTAENIKKLRAVEIIPQGNLVRISGKNEQGKTTVLDSIFWALGGTKAIQEQPIRQGETKASIRLELDDLVVTRTFTPGNSYLKVENKEGTSFKSPQAMLDKLVGKLSFDPLAFAQADPKAQRAWLLQVTGLAVDEDRLHAIAGTVEDGETALDILNATYKAVFDARTLINRQLEQAKGALATMRRVEPTEPVSVADLMAQYRAAQEQERRATEHEREQVTLMDAVTEWEEAIEDLEAQLAEARQKLARAQSALTAWRSWPHPDLAGIEEALTSAESINAQAQAYRSYQDRAEVVTRLQADADIYTKRLEAIKEYEQELVTQARFPIEGLGFANGGVTYQGVPFSQASSAQKLQVSLAMAMALNPTLRVIRIDNASLLDSEHLAVVERMAKEKDYQIWAEVIDESGHVGVYIEEGKVVNIPPENRQKGVDHA